MVMDDFVLLSLFNVWFINLIEKETRPSNFHERSRIYAQINYDFSKR